MGAFIVGFFALLTLAGTASPVGHECGSLVGGLCDQEDVKLLDDEMPATVALLQGSKSLHFHDGSSLLQSLVEPSTAGVGEDDSSSKSGSSSNSSSLLWIHVPRSSSGLFLGLERQNASSNGSSRSSDSQHGQQGEAHPGALDAAAWRKHRGSLAAMFRKPTERMHSSWAWHAAASSTNGGNVSQPRAYARRVTGLTTKLLAGQWVGESCSSKELECTQRREVPKLALALARLDGFRFVGLTEEQGLSVCLFHAMFGGECQPSDFEQTHRGNYAHSTSEIERFFHSFIDPYDEAVHQKASSIFWSNVWSHNLSAERCRTSICPGAAEFFPR